MEKVIHRLDWEDERAACDGCKWFYRRHMETRYTADEMVKFMRVNHPMNRWMFEVAEVNDSVAVVKYMRRSCKKKGLEPMPEGLLHRCPAFRPKIDTNIKEDDWWQQEEKGSSIASRQSWWQE
jgi:hypothetical protein